MPSMSTVVLVICISIALGSVGQGAPILDDLFSGFVRDSQLASVPAKEGTIVKRRIYTDNPDGRLKQVSLQSLIGDVEDSLVNTALSVSSVAHNHEAVVPEVTPGAHADDADRTITKRETEDKQTTTTSGAAAAVTATAAPNTNTNGQFVTTEATPESKHILLQTTQKVPAANGVPAHILIDRVAVQPHQGGLPFIPAFQVYHTKVISATFKEPSSSTAADGSSSETGTKSTKISIAQTAVQTTNAAGAVPVITIGTPTATTTATTNPSGENTETPATTTILDTTKSTATTIQLQNVQPSAATEALAAAAATATGQPATTTTIAASSTEASTTTTKLPIVQLKEAEEELKEKVAEIEAEPVILTARV